MHYLLSIYLMINLYMYRTNHHTLEQLRNNFHEISTISRQEVKRVNNTFAGILTAYGQEGNIFSICSITGQFKLHFLNVITTSLLFTSFTNCYTSRDSTYDVTVAERRVGAYLSSRTWRSPLHIDNIFYLFFICIFQQLGHQILVLNVGDFEANFSAIDVWTVWRIVHVSIVMLI